MLRSRQAAHPSKRRRVLRRDEVWQCFRALVACSFRVRPACLFVCLHAQRPLALWRGSLLTGQTRTATIIAQTHCSCFRVSKTAFDSVLTKCAPQPCAHCTPHPNIPPQHTAHKVASASSAGAAHRRGPAGHARVAVERAFLPGPSSLPLRTAAVWQQRLRGPSSFFGCR